MRIYFRIFYLIVALLFLSINLYAKDFLASVKDIRTEISRDNIDEALKILGSLNINNETDQELVDLLFGDIYLKINIEHSYFCYTNSCYFINLGLV